MGSYFEQTIQSQVVYQWAEIEVRGSYLFYESSLNKGPT
jgi:hypothetical protein